MQLHFHKYQGTGNDFVMLDNRSGAFSFSAKEVRGLCDRRFGIGGDGLILLNTHVEHHFEMKYYNADGKESTLCGNGARCLVKFAHDVGLKQSNYRFLAIDGVHEAHLKAKNDVALKMNNVAAVEHHFNYSLVNTGSPHYVRVDTDVMHIDVCRQGRDIRYSHEFAKEGININFVEQLPDKHKLLVRTYERGVEDETFSCGTGVVAAALVCYHNDNGYNSVGVKTKGGELCVEFDKIGERFENIWLIGPAKKVFEGTIELQKG